MLAKRPQDGAKLGIIHRQIGKRQHESQSGKCISAPPCRLAQRRMPIKAVPPQIKLLHECQVARGHIKVLRVPCQLPGFGQKRNSHEDRIAHFVVERHRFLHFAARRKTEVGCLANELGIAGIPGSFSQLGEYKVPSKSQRCGSFKRALPPVHIWRRKLLDVRDASHAKLTDKRQPRNIGQLVEVMAVDLCQLGRKLPSRTTKAPIELPVCFG